MSAIVPQNGNPMLPGADGHYSRNAHQDAGPEFECSYCSYNRGVIKTQSCKPSKHSNLNRRYVPGPIFAMRAQRIIFP